MPDPFFSYKQFYVKQFSFAYKNSCISAIVRTLSGVITLGQTGPGSDGNEGVLRIR